MGGKKKYINIFGSFTEPFNWYSAHNITIQYGFQSRRLVEIWCSLQHSITAAAVNQWGRPVNNMSNEKNNYFCHRVFQMTVIHLIT